MSLPALYDALHSFKDVHMVVLKFAEGLGDDQLNCKPEPTKFIPDVQVFYG